MRAAILGGLALGATGASAQIPMPPTGMGMPGGPPGGSAAPGAMPGMPAQMPPTGMPGGAMPRGIGVAPLSPGKRLYF